MKLKIIASNENVKIYKRGYGTAKHGRPYVVYRYKNSKLTTAFLEKGFKNLEQIMFGNWSNAEHFFITADGNKIFLSDLRVK